MIKDLAELQKKSKHAHFAKRLTAALRNSNIEPSPAVVASVFNKHSKVTKLKPHTVRKWLLKVSQPRTEMLLLIAYASLALITSAARATTVTLMAKNYRTLLQALTNCLKTLLQP